MYNVLYQVKKSCEKVLSLSVREPLMKVLAGVEYILRRSQVLSTLSSVPSCVYNVSFKDWEAYAASHVSLCSQLEQLTHLILDWRKLELRFVSVVCLALSHENKQFQILEFSSGPVFL